MKKLYLIICVTFILFNTSFALNRYLIVPKEIFRAGDTVKSKTTTKPSAKSSDTKARKSGLFKTGIKIHFPPFKSDRNEKTSSESDNSVKKAGATPQSDDEKTVSNVKVYPNPVDNEINLSYRVNKDSNVTIKIMDVLGNEITTLMSQKLTAGEQINTFNISSRLNSGFYFIRLMVGNEVVVKRISVL